MPFAAQSRAPASRWQLAQSIAAWLCAGWCASGHATPLTCAKPVLALEVPAGQGGASGFFELVNSGKSEVAITRVTSSCGCTVATLEKHTLAPGEGCRVQAVFSAGDRSGVERQTLSVETGDDHGAPLVLTVRVRVETYLELSPRLASWGLGSTPLEQVFECSSGTSRPIRLTGVRSSDPRIVVGKIDEVVPGRLYRARVLAGATPSAFIAQLVFHAEVAGTGEQVVTAIAIVR